MGIIAAKINLNSLKYYFYYIWSKITSSFYYVFDLKNTGTQSNLKTAELNKEEIKQKAQMLVEEYGNSVLRLAYTYLKNMEDSEEVLQDVLVKYLKKTPKFESKTHEKAWLLKVTSNLSKNRIKYNKTREHDELSEELIAQNREDLSFVWEAVEQLPQNFREAVHLFYHEGYSVKQISFILNRKESSIRSDLSRGRTKLREILKEAYDFE